MPQNPGQFESFEAKPHDYKRALSDLGGIDAKSHANNPDLAVVVLRNWFVDTVNLKNVPSGSAIWEKFVDFRSGFYDEMEKAGFSKRDIMMIPVREYISAIRDWLKTHS